MIWSSAKIFESKLFQSYLAKFIEAGYLFLFFSLRYDFLHILDAVRKANQVLFGLKLTVGAEIFVRHILCNFILTIW